MFVPFHDFEKDVRFACVTVRVRHMVHVCNTEITSWSTACVTVRVRHMVHVCNTEITSWSTACVTVHVRRMMHVCNTKITSWSTRKFQNKNNILFALSVIQSECTKIHCSTIDPCTCWVTNPLLSPRSAAACVTWFTLWCWGPLVLFSRWPSQEMHSALQPVAPHSSQHHTQTQMKNTSKWYCM